MNAQQVNLPPLPSVAEARRAYLQARQARVEALDRVRRLDDRATNARKALDAIREERDKVAMPALGAAVTKAMTAYDLLCRAALAESQAGGRPLFQCNTPAPEGL